MVATTSFEMVSDKSQNVTVKLVQEMCELAPLPNDRRFSETHADKILNSILAGKGITFQWCSCYVEETGKWHRINGQHTSTVLRRMIEQGLDKDRSAHFDTLRVYWAKYRAKTIADAASLWSQHDNTIITRKANDVYGVHAGSNPDLAGVSHRHLTVCAGGVALAHWWTMAHHTTAEHRVQFMLAKPEFVIWLHSVLKDASKLRHMLRRSVACAMFVTWKKDRKDADRFWTEVRDETGTQPTSPSRFLSKLLLTSTLHKGGSKKKPVGEMELAVKCVNAWNAFRRLDEVKQLIYHNGQKLPAAL